MYPTTKAHRSSSDTICSRSNMCWSSNVEYSEAAGGQTIKIIDVPCRFPAVSPHRKIYFNIFQYFNLHLNSAASWKPRHVASVFAGVKGRASQVHPAQHAKHKKQSLDFLQTSSTMSTFICQHLSAVYSEWLRARLLPLEELTALRCLAWRSRVSFCNFASAVHSAVQPAILQCYQCYSMLLSIRHDLPWLAMTAPASSRERRWSSRVYTSDFFLRRITVQYCTLHMNT